jgi:glycosyltransferase involved in cell wall biosynthesis
MKFSIIVPVYNRPDEIKELLSSLSLQTEKNFEIVVVEDGSNDKCEDVIAEFSDRMEIQYFYKENEKPAVARNYGAARAQGDYFIFFDSDCIIPENYFEKINAFFASQFVDAFGGPDAAHPDFNREQRAISYAMTSFFTTGGIRGGKETIDKFYPRSFNMGVSREAFERIGGFPVTKMHPGEDMVFSIEIIRQGLKTTLIREAFVYHKRRNTLKSFFRQVRLFGKTRVVISKFYPETFKIHFFAPSIFTLGTAVLLVLTYFNTIWVLPIIFYCILIFTDSFIENQKTDVALLSVVTSFVQLIGYGVGFMESEFSFRVLKKNPYDINSGGFYMNSQKSDKSSVSDILIEE